MTELSNGLTEHISCRLGQWESFHVLIVWFMFPLFPLVLFTLIVHTLPTPAAAARSNSKITSLYSTLLYYVLLLYYNSTSSQVKHLLRIMLNSHISAKIKVLTENFQYMIIGVPCDHLGNLSLLCLTLPHLART